MSGRSDKEQPTEMYDDKTASLTTSYHISYLPLSPVAPGFPCPDSDR
jgi:hypothetical protein